MTSLCEAQLSMYAEAELRRLLPCDGDVLLPFQSLLPFLGGHHAARLKFPQTRELLASGLRAFVSSAADACARGVLHADLPGPDDQVRCVIGLAHRAVAMVESERAAWRQGACAVLYNTMSAEKLLLYELKTVILWGPCTETGDALGIAPATSLHAAHYEPDAATAHALARSVSECVDGFQTDSDTAMNRVANCWNCALLPEVKSGLFDAHMANRLIPEASPLVYGVDGYDYVSGHNGAVAADVLRACVRGETNVQRAVEEVMAAGREHIRFAGATMQLHVPWDLLDDCAYLSLEHGIPTAVYNRPHSTRAGPTAGRLKAFFPRMGLDRFPLPPADLGPPLPTRDVLTSTNAAGGLQMRVIGSPDFIQRGLYARLFAPPWYDRRALHAALADIVRIRSPTPMSDRGAHIYP